MAVAFHAVLAFLSHAAYGYSTAILAKLPLYRVNHLGFFRF